MRKDQVKNKEDVINFFKNHRFNNLLVYTHLFRENSIIVNESTDIDVLISRILDQSVSTYYKNGNIHSGTGSMRSINDTILICFSVYGKEKYSIREILKVLDIVLVSKDYYVDFCYDISKNNFWRSYYMGNGGNSKLDTAYLYREGFTSLPRNFSYADLM